MLALGFQERLGDAVERLVPRDRHKLPRAFRADARQRAGQPVRMMDAFGIARHFRADDALGVGMVGRAMHPTDAVSADHLDVERADRRAVVRADGRAAHDVERGVHPRLQSPNVAKGRRFRKRDAFTGQRRDRDVGLRTGARDHVYASGKPLGNDRPARRVGARANFWGAVMPPDYSRRAFLGGSAAGAALAFVPGAAEAQTVARDARPPVRSRNADRQRAALSPCARLARDAARRAARTDRPHGNEEGLRPRPMRRLHRPRRRQARPLLPDARGDGGRAGR